MTAAIVLAAAALLSLSACGSHTATSTGGNHASDAAATGTSGGSGRAFTTTTASGKQVHVPGKKPTVVFFFATGCSGCLSGAASMAKAQHQAGTQANFVAVDIDPGESPQTIREFLREAHAGSLAYASDSHGRLTRAYHLTQLSTAMIVTPAGKTHPLGVDPTATQIQTQLAKATS